MRLSLIGMAGTGKSFWSGKLAGRGFRRYCCDELIAGRLAGELLRPDGTAMTMGRWMGLPHEARYRARAARYLALEREVMEEIFAVLDSPERNGGRDIVVDTSGSVIYTGGDILATLRRLTRVVHLSTPTEVQDRMLAAYLKEPGPMLWGNAFSMEPGEDPGAALARCYPRLLAAREAMYAQYADAAVDYHTRRDPGFRVEDFLKAAGGIERVQPERR